MAHRIERVNEAIKNELSTQIKYNLNDPRIREVEIGVTKVKTTPDMKFAKVYISVYADKEEQEQIFKVVEKAKGFLRKQLASVLTTRFTPELVFELDDSLDYAMHIDKLLREINDGK